MLLLARLATLPPTAVADAHWFRRSLGWSGPYLNNYGYARLARLTKKGLLGKTVLSGRACWHRGRAFPRIKYHLDLQQRQTAGMTVRVWL